MTAAGPIDQLKKWWDELRRLGPKFGFYPEGCKSWLVIRKTAKGRAESIFKLINIKITTEGKRYLGAAIDTTNYRQNYMKEKLQQ